jgi:hypothetical protein
MALTTGGQISFSDINIELGQSPGVTLALGQAETGNPIPINTNSPSRPDGVSPYRISEWFGYDHTAGGGIDADAQAFITAAGITDPTQQSAIDTLVTDLKNYGIWSQMFAIYPFVGGTASTHKWNLKDPRDLDAAFRLVFFGGLTHSSTGILPNGSTGYADTFFVPSTNINTTDYGSLGVYSRTNLIDATQQVDMSCATLVSPNGGEFGILIGFSTTDTQAAFTCEFPQASTFTYRRAAKTPTVNTTGFWAGSQNNTTMHFQRNGASLSPTLDAKLANRVVPNNKLVIFAQRFQASTLRRFAKRQLAFSFIGKQLTATQLSNYYTAVQAFQTTLGRQI